MNSVELVFNGHAGADLTGRCRKVPIGRGLTEVDLDIAQLGCNHIMLSFKIKIILLVSPIPGIFYEAMFSN